MPDSSPASGRRPLLGDAPNTSGHASPGWPYRRHYLLLAALFAAVAVYGSVVPLRGRPLEFSEAVRQFKDLLERPIGGSRSDWAANVLLFVPIGYCLMGALVADRRNRVVAVLCAGPVILACALSSVAIEFSQLWFPNRIPSLSDVLAQMLGTVAGVILWLGVGQTLTDWLRFYTAGQRPRKQIDWLLQAYLLGLLVYSVLPLDLIVSPAEFYRQTKIALRPFSDVSWDLASLYGLFRDVVIFVPVGMLAATWFTSPVRPVRPMGMSILLGALVVLAVELVQLPVHSRYSSTTDLITGTLGVAAGAWLMRRWRGQPGEDLPPPVTGGAARYAWLWLGLAVLYAVFLMGVFCAPFERIDDAELIRARLEGFFRLPFAAYHRGTPFNAVSDVLKKLLLFAPLGALLALAAGSLPVPRPVRRILLTLLLLGAAGVATAIEMAQVLLPPHVPDVTDVISCTAGAAAGMLVSLRVLDARKAA